MKIIKLLFFIAGIIIVAIMLLITVATISRYAFGRSMAWATEIAAYSLLFITFLGGPFLARYGGHVNVDIFPNLLKGKSSNLLNLLNSFLSFIVCSLISWYAINAAVDAYVNKLMIVSFIDTPRYILIATVALGFILMAISYLKIIFDYIYKLIK